MVAPARFETRRTGSDTRYSRSESTSTSALVLPPASKLAWTMRATELYAYEYFRRETAEPLQLIQPAGPWVRLALQMSLESEPVLRAITAVGAAHRANISVTHASLAVAMSTDDKMLSRKLYGKALSVLQTHIEKVTHHKAALEPVLVTCLLLITFEILFEDEHTAFIHYTLARRLVDQLEADRIDVKSTFQLQSPATTNDLSSTFDRLRDDLAPLLDQIENQDLTQRELTRHIFPLRKQLSSQLTSLIAEGHAILHEFRSLAAPYWQDRLDLDPAARLCLTYCHSRSVAVPGTSTLETRRKTVLESLQAWSDMIATHHLGESRCAQLLMIRHFTSLHSLSTCRATSEMSTDSFSQKSIEILDVIEAYLAHSHLRTREQSRDESTSIAHDRGVLPALHIIATKSRALPTRSRAVALLRKYRRREGLRWSPVVAAIAEAVINLEESRADALQWGDDVSASGDSSIRQVPEAARFAEIVICGERMDATHVRLICARFDFGSDGRKIVLEEFEGEGGPLVTKATRTRTFDLGGIAWGGDGSVELDIA
ncbi:hypothetical protein B0A48_06066 [Cryoendolithus antarcticus]|uniref:Uncharacterized protein n=1 Tax=Cryoendolithus antarcticus TaxID=1507870 RepID=A0A1V8TCT5_9PEZI|nr:hypothetical protein B0A48_06066 [Cryoendolithus antarcticus]